MAAASEARRFEEAARFRDRLREMAQVFEIQAVYGRVLSSADVVGLAGGADGWAVYVLCVRHGSVVGGETKRLTADHTATEGEILAAFIQGFYTEREDIPARVVLPVEPAGRPLLERFLAARSGRKVRVVVPSRGRGLELLLTARRNALSMVTRHHGRPRADGSLWDSSGLFPGEMPPRRIEVYDASSLQGREAVVGMVLWEGGAFRTDEYRRFMVKLAPGSDDYASIREAVGRRLRRVSRGEFPAPDLILVDGGAGHVGAVRNVLERTGRDDIRLIGIAKGRQRREGDRIITADGRDAGLASDSAMALFLGALRDEVHRCAVTYHRQRRGMRLRESLLDEVRGIGPRRKAILVRHFGDPGAVARATLDDLLAVPGIPADVAEAVHKHFHPSA